MSIKLIKNCVPKGKLKKRISLIYRCQHHNESLLLLFLSVLIGRGQAQKQVVEKVFFTT
ncbi:MULTISPECIES: hypothetical protein [Bacillus cereus group]|uniref:hypothetical protein n=1 Tax=Bacillus cereus group TaxID=86661 RepID=UPI0012F94D8D|nr:MULTISPECIES: hypothetical protein [Bacillus cereus group]MED2787269.1 hypothetical protein [Bacillus thuringiensis]MED2827427.1 hypothetical protein [Bacillus thuringiensis]MED2833988.1 hypothetical protein [Bacillus thuringiensis]MED2848806.1 hypothetical protein [Bacillus thuringiensis]MED2857386.1 hypothetical protein [Bacillus thuringiensis]